MSLTTNPARTQPPSGGVPTVTPARPERQSGMCPVCNCRKLVRLDGLLCKHQAPYTDAGVQRCAGSDSVPIPVPVPEVDYSRAGRDAGRVLDRWDFLSMPLETLLPTTRAFVQEVAAPDLTFGGSIAAVRERGFWEWHLHMPIGQDVLERDVLVRGLLAAAHGVSVDGWPIKMGLRAA